MTQPVQVPTAGDAVPVQGPDGKTYVGIRLQCGAVQAMCVVPADDADRFIDGVAAAVREVSAAGRRTNGGLLVAPANAMLPPLAGNGHRRPPTLPG